MVAALRRFADRGRTLACTIHQPRAETFALFHQLLLIKAGETMYCGPVAQAHMDWIAIGLTLGVAPAATSFSAHPKRKCSPGIGGRKRNPYWYSRGVPYPPGNPALV